MSSTAHYLETVV